MKKMSQINKSVDAAIIATLAGASLAITGCGKTAFTVTDSLDGISAPGSMIVPAKVDILLVTDDSGSAYEAYPALSKEIPNFLNQLDRSGWDYHFASAPLTSYRPISQVVGSIHDSGRGKSWVPAFPGQSSSDSGMIAAGAFRLPSDFTELLSVQDISNKSNGSENGFQNIQSILTHGTAGTNFIREDAMTIILVVGNGNDTSGISYDLRADGVSVPNKASEKSSFSYYENWFRNFKNSSGSDTHITKFYSAVSYQQTASCLGGQASIGDRYIRMAAALGGKGYNICSQSVGQVLTSLASQLRGTRLNFRTKYLFLAQEPNLSTITVTRHIGGDASNSVVIPQDETNGWTYVGQVSDVHAIDYPVPMNKQSGYAIELHGSAKLIGDDTATVTSKPAGMEDSASK